MPSQADFPTDLQALEHDYELIRELGHGGMAAVYLARRRENGRLVAIKAIRARYLDDSDVLQRFAREARTVADLDHPNILRTEAIEEIDDRAVAIIMDYIDGGTVRDRLREYGAFSAEATEGVLRDVANALAYAHRRGIVHRDVKPENVFLDRHSGRALLADFGIARRIEGDAPITLLGAALGTPQYMSPEQIDGARVDGRSDIYSVGVLGWELLTGRRPWAGENLYSIIYKQKHEHLAPITTLRPRVPANLLMAIERALEKDPARRWQSAEELVEHLAYEPPPVLAQPYPAAAAPRDDEATLQFRREPDTSIAREGSVAASDRIEREAAIDIPPPRDSTPGAPPRGTARPAPARTTGPMGGRRGERPFLRRPIMRAVLLVVPLLIALGSLYVVLDLPTLGSDSGTTASDAGPLTSSGGTVVLDSTPTGTAAAKPRPDSAPNASPPVSPSPAATRSAPAPKSMPVPSRTDSGSGRGVGQTTATRANPVVRPLPSAADPAPATEPTPRCRVATVADQRACLLAYIAVNDAVLQRVYDSLIVEQRRIAGTRRGAADPPLVRQLRVEQRAWVSERDRECMRSAGRPAVALWARERSACFAEKSAARRDELRNQLERARSRR